ncbi:MAG: hypothetical protein HYR88_01365 [Verrucomicrobia bacterium]|nr:hypothetical protein [Verrucomicrobiota bacterium]
MMMFLCLSAGMLYWGVLVFGVTGVNFWGRIYWLVCAFLGLLASSLGCREIIRTLGSMLEAQDTAIEVLESAESKTRAELRRRNQDPNT